MRNGTALDQFDGVGDDLVGDEGSAELHELELDVDGWEDETSSGDAAPAAVAPAPAPAKKATTTRKGTKR